MQSLPFCPGLVRSLSLRFVKGVEEIKLLTDSL